MAALHVYRTEGDRLAEHWGVRDELGAMVQLGVDVSSMHTVSRLSAGIELALGMVGKAITTKAG